MLRNAARDLTLAHDDEVGSEFRQMLDLVVGMRAGDDFKFRVCRPRLLDEIAVFERVGNRADEPSRFGKIGSLQDSGLGRIARDRLDAPRAKPVDDFAALLDDEKRLTLSHHGFRHQTADTAAADDDCMIAERCDRQFLGPYSVRMTVTGRVLRGALAQPWPCLIESEKQDRVREDREDRACKDQVPAGFGQQLESDAQARKDEGELADLRQGGGAGHGGEQRLAQGKNDQECGKRIAAHDDQEGREDGSGFAHDDAGIEQHANGHEKQHRERVPQRQSFLSGLLAES